MAAGSRVGFVDGQSREAGSRVQDEFQGPKSWMLRGASGLEFQASNKRLCSFATWRLSLHEIRGAVPHHTNAVQCQSKDPTTPAYFLPFRPSCPSHAVVARCYTVACLPCQAFVAAGCPVVAPSPRLSTVPHCLTTPRVPMHHRNSQASSSFSTLVDGPSRKGARIVRSAGACDFRFCAHIAQLLVSEAERPDVNQVGTNILNYLVIRAPRCGDDRPHRQKK